MAITAQRQVAIPAGVHKGLIIKAEETKKVFNPGRGPEETVEFTIQPAYKVDGAQTLPVNFLYAPVLNGLSGLSKLLTRLDAHPAEGAAWDPSDLIGLEVEFTAEIVDGFARVVKDSVRLPKA